MSFSSEFKKKTTTSGTILAAFPGPDNVGLRATIRRALARAGHVDEAHAAVRNTVALTARGRVKLRDLFNDLEAPDARRVYDLQPDGRVLRLARTSQVKDT